jgi:hypothetical protein
MVGNDQVRFCRHCDLSVNDLSRMTQAKAEKLVRRSKGRLCLRIHRDPIGEIITRDSVERLYVISRRASRLAAGAFTAMISMSAGAYAQTTPAESEEDDRPVAQQQIKRKAAGTFSWLKVSVIDPNGTVVPGVDVTATNEQTGAEEKAVTDDAGVAKIWLSGDYSYSVTSSGQGFNEDKRNGINLRRADETLLDVVLMVGGAAGGGMISVTYQTPMVRAARAADLDLVNKLLRDGVDVDLPEDDGTTALYVAVESEEYEMVLRLLRASANANALRENGENILFTLDDDDDVEMVQLLIKSGAKVNQVSKDGNTPLMRFAEWDDAERIQLLLDAGAQVNAQNDLGLSALMIAAREGNEDAVKTLLAAGANPRLRNADGKTAIQLAQTAEEDEVVEILRSAPRHAAAKK